MKKGDKVITPEGTGFIHSMEDNVIIVDLDHPIKDFVTFLTPEDIIVVE